MLQLRTHARAIMIGLFLFTVVSVAFYAESAKVESDRFIEASNPGETAVAEQAQKTAVAEPAQKTAVAEQAQKTAVAEQAKKTAVAEQAQKTAVAEQAQKTAVAEQARKTAVAEQAQRTAVAEQAQRTAVAEQAQKQVWVVGPDGQRENIGPTLDRIDRGESHPHRNDGAIFNNREKRLPIHPRGYYHEFVHPTAGHKGPGAQRIVKGEQDEIYYTPDHYQTFQDVHP